MVKNIPVYIAFVLSMLVLSASAQQTDSSKKAVNIDTTNLDRYHIDPPKNSLPVRMRLLSIRQQSVPVAMLDYNVNYWRKWITVGIGFSQSANSNHYSSGGGSSSIALNGDFDYKTEYNRAPFDYVGELRLQYGSSKNKDQGSRKTADRIFLDNKFATKMSKSWFFFGSLTFESQFDKGYIYNNNGPSKLISRFMAPGYLTESVGFEYKPSNFVDVRFGTGTARQTFLVDTTLYKNQPANYGVPKGKKFKNDLAFQLVATFVKDIAKNINLNTRYALFIPYEKHISFITHRVDVILGAQVNRLIRVTINGTMVYDKTVNGKPQGTEGMAIGVAYRFPY